MAAVLRHVNLPEYRPPCCLLDLQASSWPVFTESSARIFLSNSTSVCREDYCRTGKTVLQHAIFTMTLPYLCGERPVNFSKILENSVRSDAVLKVVMRKIDAGLLDNGVEKAEIDRVDGGFEALVGLKWIECNCNSQLVTELFHPFFKPLLEVARVAYDASVGPPRTQSSSQKKIPADIQFLMNARSIVSIKYLYSPRPSGSILYKTDRHESDSDTDSESDGGRESVSGVKTATTAERDRDDLTDDESEPSFLALVGTLDDSPPLSFSPGSTEHNHDFLEKLAAPPVSPWKHLDLRLKPGPTYSAGDFKLRSGFELATVADGFPPDLEPSPQPVFKKRRLYSARESFVAVADRGGSPGGSAFKSPDRKPTPVQRSPLSPHNGQKVLHRPDKSPLGKALRFGMAD
ncbi:hypothetical protein B0H11DRAFT_2283197 [Mycena galericulata]|nr:hypothetical protein B0H11DRAFT_2283197 [Mycena galericulata]